LYQSLDHQGALIAVPGFFLTLIGVLLASLGGRDQQLMARLAGHFPGSLPLLAVGWFSVAVSTGLAVYAAVLVAPLMPGAAKWMMVGLALLFAAIELAWQATRRRRSAGRAPPLQEPTRSFFATLMVLVAGQIADAARFMVFALALAMAAPGLVMLGGVLAGGAAISMGWTLAPAELARLAPAWLQGSVAVVLMLAGLTVGLRALGLI